MYLRWTCERIVWISFFPSDLFFGRQKGRNEQRISLRTIARTNRSKLKRIKKTSSPTHFWVNSRNFSKLFTFGTREYCFAYCIASGNYFYNFVLIHPTLLPSKLAMSLHPFCNRFSKYFQGNKLQRAIRLIPNKINLIGLNLFFVLRFTPRIFYFYFRKWISKFKKILNFFRESRMLEKSVIKKISKN